MDVTVINHSPTFRRLNVSGKDPDGKHIVVPIKLNPGANLLQGEDAARFDQAIKLKPVEDLFNAGILELNDTPEGTKTYTPGCFIRNLSDFKTLDALTAIGDCKSLRTLRKWATQDPRKDIQEALRARNNVLNPPVVEN